MGPVWVQVWVGATVSPWEAPCAPLLPIPAPLGAEHPCGPCEHPWPSPLPGSCPPVLRPAAAEMGGEAALRQGVTANPEVLGYEAPAPPRKQGAPQNSCNATCSPLQNTWVLFFFSQNGAQCLGFAGKGRFSHRFLETSDKKWPLKTAGKLFGETMTWI